MKKRKLKTVLKQADDKTLEIIAKHPVTDETTKKRIYEAIEKNMEIMDVPQNIIIEADQAPEIRHTSWMQYASMVACIAVIVGTAGIGFHLKKNAPIIQPAQGIAGEIENSELDTTEKIYTGAYVDEASTESPQLPEELPNYDMSTKEGIYAKMLNSEDNFNKVYAIVMEKETAEENLITLMNLWADLTTEQSLEYVSRKIPTEENGISDLIAENRPPLVTEDEYYGHFMEYCDGESLYDIDTEERTYRAVNASPLGHRDDTPLDGEMVRQWFLKSNPEEEPILRYEATNSRVGGRYLEPTEFVLYGLSDFDKWEITGETEYIGRECIIIAGDAYGCQWYAQGTNFTAYIDKETGCLLRNVVYDADENLVDWHIVTNIVFDEDVEIEFPNLDEYTEIKDEPIDMEEYYAYKTNSKGETYGIGGQYTFTWENYDLLPDLILFDYDKRNDVGYYQRKDEIFEMFPEDPERNTYRQEHNKLEGDIPIEVNMYDCEGNFAYTITYYHEP